MRTSAVPQVFAVLYRYIHMQLRFCFELDPVEDIVPWGEGEDRNLHWFGLTSGRYWVSTPLGEALRYTDEEVKLWELSSPYVDYQVARLFEDLQYVLPMVLESVPPDIATIVSDGKWFDRAEKWIDGAENEDERRRLCYDAMEWYQNRALDTMYLVDGPLFHLWRTGDDVWVRWEPTVKNPKGVWSTPEGQFTVSVDQFVSAAHAFLDGVLGAMQERVDAIQTRGWHRADCKLDIPLLHKEQRQRTARVEELKERRPETDWENVRSLIERLSAEF